MPLPRVCSARAYPRRAPTCAQHGKSTLGPQGRFAPLRGGRWPSLTADRRLAPGKAGRDGGMVYSIKQRDGRITGVRPPNRQPEPTRISKEAQQAMGEGSGVDKTPLHVLVAPGYLVSWLNYLQS